MATGRLVSSGSDSQKSTIGQTNRLCSAGWRISGAILQPPDGTQAAPMCTAAKLASDEIGLRPIAAPGAKATEH